MLAFAELVRSAHLPLEVRTDVDEIYSQYIQDDAEFQVNLTQSVKKKIDKCFEEDQVARDVFDKAQDEIFEVIYQHLYPKWLKKQALNDQLLIESSDATAADFVSGESKHPVKALLRKMSLRK